MQHNIPDDFVLASGESFSVREFIERAFLEIGEEILWQGSGIKELGYSKNNNKILVEIDPRYFLPTEVNSLLGDTSKAKKTLGWEPIIKFDKLVKEMVREDLKLIEIEQRTRHYGIDD